MASGHAQVEQDGKNKSLAQTFLKGTGISTWQNTGDDGVSNWTRFAYSRWPFSKLGISATRGKYKIGKSCNFWERCAVLMCCERA